MEMRAKKEFVGQWGMLLLALLLLGGAVVHSLYNSYVDIETLERERLRSHVRILNINLSDQLQRADEVLRELRDELRNIPANNWQQAIPNRRFEVIAKAFSGVRTVLAVDAQGIIRFSNHQKLLGADVGQREYFRRAVANPDSGRLFLSPPFKTLLGVWGMTLTRVIIDARGQFAGIVVATLDPEYFKTLLGSINDSPDMWSAIAHSEGTQFLMVPEREGQKGMNLAKPGSFFTRHIESGKAENLFTGTVYATGEERMMALYTIDPQGLGLDARLVVAASRDLAAIFADWKSHAWSQGLTFAAILVVTVAALAGFQLYQREHRRQVSQTRHALRDTRQQLLEIIDFLPDATFVIDREKKVVIWNRAIERMTGVTKEEMLGKGDYEYTIPFYGHRRQHLLDLFDVDDAELAARYSNVRRSGAVLDAETFCPALNGGQGVHVWATGVPLFDAAGERIGAIESIRDISALKKTEEYLRKLTHGIENSASAMLITDVQGRIEYVNRKFTQLTGYTAEEAIGENPRILRSEATPLEVFADLWKTILAGQEWRGELLNRRKNGEVYWSIASINPLRNAKGEISHFIANFEDINERKNAEATIERLAYFDPLTDLPNRRMLHDRLELALKRSRRQGSGAALLYLDLDSFKHVNDTLGHPAGDKLLREMATRFRDILRDDDIVFRLGGDEFAMILHDIHHDHDVVPVAQKLLDAATAPVDLDGSEVVVTASTGIALFPKDGAEGKTLEKHADIALYHAKAEGKNTFRFFSAELNRNFGDRIAMEQRLRRVLEREELELFYQPRIAVASGEVVGVEALLRWNSPEFGLVPPLRFIPLAEEIRQIVPIGEWVIRSACRQQLAWQGQGLPLVVSVNLSAVQFKSSGLVERIAAIFEETGVEPKHVEFELTESALVEKPEEAARLLGRLRALGCGISIDDFGTGYSSLSYLKIFPVTILKIDRSFVRDIAGDAGDLAIAQSVVDLAGNLSIQTVAEGVEDTEQLAILRRIGCTYVQGYLYSRPVPADRLPAVVAGLQQAAREAAATSAAPA